ncbi:Nif3-like dinuclear metal center hexameric protein [Nocardioides ungokensis]|uniref:Nif3-like dinuclear metal center hexameric protein n=1 Tax=Nocardioides ungokensis TaxID=1643322 RepID=UPI001FE5E641|nr:Nif3-like dinuclear metal center hexameric protein [Nocardioides ungokensis]
MVLPRGRRTPVVAAMMAAHPYEEPAYDLVELADPGTAATGAGRIGSVADTTLRGFAETVAAALPATAHGVRVSGDPDRVVRRVAVCGGAGDFLLDTVLRSDADVYGPATCATTRQRSSSRRTGPRWSTWRTGPPSGPGCRWSGHASPRRWAIRWRPW